MGELFRMTVVRRPKPAAVGAVIPLDVDSNFQAQLKQAVGSANARAEAVGASAALLAQPVGDELNLEGPLVAVLTALETQALPLEQLEILNRLRDDDIELASIGSIVLRISDRILALTVTGSDAAFLRRLGRYRRALWIYELATGTAPGVDSADIPAALERSLRAPLTLPEWLVLPPVTAPPTSTPPSADPDVEVRKELEATHAEIKTTLGALEELAKLPRGAYTPEAQPTRRAVLLGAAGAARVSVRSREVLRSLDADPETTDIQDSVREVTKRAETLRSKAQDLENKLAKPRVSAGALIKLGSAWRNLSTFEAPVMTLATPEPTGLLPTTEMPLFRVGVGELFTITHTLKGYRGGEVSHIENVLRGETRSRDHRRLQRTEETITSETETTEVDERSLETTSRFELQTEASKVMKEEHEINAGVGLSADFGTVKLETNLDYTYKKSTDESEKTASKLGRDVVEKAANKLTERVLEQRTRKTISEIEEKNFNAFDNREGTAHVAGVYQWIDKVYEVQVWRHDDRAYTMYDMIVPEPAALLLAAYAQGPKLAEGIRLPPAFINLDNEAEELAPNHITDTNYLKYAARYHVTTIEPPPPYLVTISAPLALTNTTSGDSDKEITPLASATKDLQIPPGYNACVGNAIADGVAAGGTAEVLLFVAGEKIEQPTGNTTFVPTHSEGTIPIAILGRNVRAAAGSVVLVCVRTDEAYTRWKIRVYAALRQAYEKELQSYNEAISVAMATDVQVRSNPLENRQVMERELRRECLALLTKQSFDSFGAINITKTPPTINFLNAAIQGPFVRFFEDAFEWSKMTFFCYPYFWAGVAGDRWSQRIRLQENDPLFGEFLRAGAARVIVPVKKGYEGALEAALKGLARPWEESASDVALSRMSAELVAEAEERDQPNRGATPTTSWEIIVPSTLVKLRKDDELPAFENPEPGVFIPSDP